MLDEGMEMVSVGDSSCDRPTAAVVLSSRKDWCGNVWFERGK